MPRTTPAQPPTRATSPPRRRRAASATESPKAPAPRGRPPRRVYINVLVRESTRRSLNVLARRHGMTQGELLDALLSGRLSPS